MIISERFAGEKILFKGDRLLLLRSIPVNAQISKATAIITPVDRNGNEGPSLDNISFVNTITGDNGETLTSVVGPPGWIEIDFHRKVTLVRVIGTDLLGATLQVDIGSGVYSEVNQNGAFRSPSDPEFTLSSNFQNLPGLAVSKIKLTQVAGLTMSVSSIDVRNSANNVALQMGDSAPFFLLPGYLVEAQSTIDFARLLQTSISNAEQQNGFYTLPLNLHSDSLSRIELGLEIELVSQQSALPENISSVKLPYKYNAVSESLATNLSITIPAGARLLSSATSARIEGSFSGSTIVQGSLDEVDTNASKIDINTFLTQAQAFSVLDKTTLPDIAIDAIDLLLTSVSSQSRLQIDIRADLDGKPDAKSLLVSALELTIDTDTSATPTWASIALSQPIKLTKSDTSDANKQKPVRYWLILQSLEGEAQWTLSDSAEDPTALLQQSTDGGLSWRENVVTDIVNQPYAEFRLRQNTDTFNVPVEVKVGLGSQASRLNLDKFAPLGRIDFALDNDELTNAANDYLDAVEQPRCPEGEQLINMDFQLELEMPSFTLLGWEQIGPGLAPIGDPLYAISINSDANNGGISQTVSAIAGCEYETTIEVNVDGDGAKLELIWRGDNCTTIKTDELSLAEDNDNTGYEGNKIFRMRAVAPVQTNQLEVRLVVPNSTSVIAYRVSLVASPQSTVNGDLLERQADQLVGWTLTPIDAQDRNMFVIDSNSDPRTINNESDFLQPAVLSQKVAINGKNVFDFAFAGQNTSESNDSVYPEVQLSFLNEGVAISGSEQVLIIRPDDAENHKLSGVVPESANQAEIKLVLPQNTKLQINNISLTSQEVQEVPITFLSKAPGDLTVTDLRIGFETQAAPLPPFPEQGLCSATNASLAPNEECCEEESSCYCNKCEQTTVLAQTSAVLLPNNRPATLGVCEACRLPLITNTGLPIDAATYIPVRQINRTNLAPADENIALSDVTNIGAARAEMLQEVGITRVNQLIAAKPEALVNILEVNEILAKNLIFQARKLLIERQLNKLRS